MTSWLKWVWEKVVHYNLVLLVHNLPSVFPRDGDDWLMAQFIAAGYNGIELLILNRVRKHQQVLFLSDILGASGCLVEKKYLQKQRQGEQWSSTKFPPEVVTEAEISLWQRAIVQVVRNGPAQINLGAFKTDGHKLWEWWVLEPQGRLFQQCRD